MKVAAESPNASNRRKDKREAGGGLTVAHEAEGIQKKRRVSVEGVVAASCAGTLSYTSSDWGQKFRTS